MKANRTLKILISGTLLSMLSSTAFCQERNWTEGLTISAEASTTISNGDVAPLWLSSNRYGTVSTKDKSSYERIKLSRPAEADSAHHWRFGYGADIMLSQNSTSTFFIQQLYGEVSWKKISLLVGSKERQIDLRNNELTSGGLSNGINAHPIPSVLLSCDYFSVPYSDHWWKIKFRGGYGVTTDGAWQERWIGKPEEFRYTSNILYHEKALYMKFGKEEKFPLTFEIGLQMMCQFGGTSYNVNGRNQYNSTIHHDNSLKAFWQALFPGGNDATDGTEENTYGNHIGSYNMALKWEQNDWMARAYFERMFEDQSMLTVQYGIYDHLLGLEIKAPKNAFFSNFVVEHLSTTDQSGAVYHDKTQTIPDKMNGRDNYYNHMIYSGWQHWGMAIGTPLITSPIYNSDHNMRTYNNRIKAWHFGLSGDPADEIHWRFLASFTRNWGCYDLPFADITNQQSFLAEASWTPKALENWSGTLAIGLDHGDLIGNSAGMQLTLRYRIF